MEQCRARDLGRRVSRELDDLIMKIGEQSSCARLESRRARSDRDDAFLVSRPDQPGLLFSIILVYMLIVINFQSWLDPFIIISALPAALAGIVWFLFMTTRPSVCRPLTGSIMCMGVATANSILVVSFAKEQLPDAESSC